MHRFAIAAALAALTLTPAVATAKKDDGPKGPKTEHSQKGKGKGDKPKPPKLKSYVLKGVVKTNDATGVTVTVAKANKHGKHLVKTDVLVPSAAKVTVADVNDDGDATLADVQVGDKVVVQLKAEKGAAGPFAAKHLVDQTYPPSLEEDSVEHDDANDDDEDDDDALQPGLDTELESEEL